MCEPSWNFTDGILVGLVLVTVLSDHGYADDNGDVGCEGTRTRNNLDKQLRVVTLLMIRVCVFRVTNYNVVCCSLLGDFEP